MENASQLFISGKRAAINLILKSFNINITIPVGKMTKDVLLLLTLFMLKSITSTCFQFCFVFIKEAIIVSKRHTIYILILNHLLTLVDDLITF